MKTCCFEEQGSHKLDRIWVSLKAYMLPLHSLLLFFCHRLYNEASPKYPIWHIAEGVNNKSLLDW